MLLHFTSSIGHHPTYSPVFHSSFYFIFCNCWRSNPGLYTKLSNCSTLRHTCNLSPLRGSTSSLRPFSFCLPQRSTPKAKYKDLCIFSFLFLPAWLFLWSPPSLSVFSLCFILSERRINKFQVIHSKDQNSHRSFLAESKTCSPLLYLIFFQHMTEDIQLFSSAPPSPSHPPTSTYQSKSTFLLSLSSTYLLLSSSSPLTHHY